MLDTNQQNHIDILFKVIRQKKFIYVSECLYDLFLPKVVNESSNFPHELVISIKNTNFKSIDFDFSSIEIEQFKSHNTPIINEWLYLELYCNEYAQLDILNYINEKILAKNIVSQFYFVRYANPDVHLRVRFKIKSNRNKKLVIFYIANLKLLNKIIKYIIVPYDPEIQRYGGLEMMKISEIIFDLDSRNVISEILNKEFEKNIVHVTMVLKIKFYLDFFKFSLNDMILFCDNNLMNFSNEFAYNSDSKTLFNKEYDQIRTHILDFEYQTFFSTHNFENDFNVVLIKNKISINNYVSLLVHMSCNRHFDINQRYCEFKTYFFTKRYINHLKHTDES